MLPGLFDISMSGELSWGNGDLHRRLLKKIGQPCGDPRVAPLIPLVVQPNLGSCLVVDFKSHGER
jgi:hypothetical protein